MGSDFGGKKWASRALYTSSGEVISGRLGNLGVTLLTGNCLADHMVCGVACSWKDFQCWAFAAVIDLKYFCLESLANALSCGSFEARAFQEDKWNSFHSVDSSGDHHGFALTEERRRGVRAFRNETRVLRCESNQFSNECLVGRFGGGEPVPP